MLITWEKIEKAISKWDIPFLYSIFYSVHIWHSGMYNGSSTISVRLHGESDVYDNVSAKWKTKFNETKDFIVYNRNNVTVAFDKEE